MNDLKYKIITYLHNFIGISYRWGGNGPLFDCSSFVSEGLKSVGLLPHKADYNAQMLYDAFKKYGNKKHDIGRLCFYGKDEKNITHVDICIDDNYIIGCTSGDSTTKTIEMACIQGAFIKIRPITYRRDLFDVCDLMGD